MNSIQHTSAHPPFFVSAANVAGRLLEVMQIAKEISLAAKNAKAIAERAGEKASGFSPITDFINEMGSNTVDLVAAINTEAEKVSRIAIAELRANETEQRLLNARSMIEGDCPVFLDSLIKEANAESSDLAEVLEQEKKKLVEILHEIHKQIRSSAVISTCSRVEATRAEQYETSLEVVAQNVEGAAKDISEILKECESLLNQTATIQQRQ